MAIERGIETIRLMAEKLFPGQAVLLYRMEGENVNLLVVTERQGDERMLWNGITSRVIYVSENVLGQLNQNRKWNLSSLMYLFWLREGTVLVDPDGLLGSLRKQHNTFSPTSETEQFLASFWSYFVDAMDMAEKGLGEEATYIAKYSSYKAITALLLARGYCVFESRRGFLDFQVDHIICELQETRRNDESTGELVDVYKKIQGIESLDEKKARDLISRARSLIQEISECV